MGGATEKSQKIGGATEVYGLAETKVPGIGRGAIQVCATQGICRRPSPRGSDSRGRVELCEAHGGEMVRWRCVMPKKTISKAA
jgi:hypothetical protein